MLTIFQIWAGPFPAHNLEMINFCPDFAKMCDGLHPHASYFFYCDENQIAEFINFFRSKNAKNVQIIDFVQVLRDMGEKLGPLAGPLKNLLEYIDKINTHEKYRENYRKIYNLKKELFETLLLIKHVGFYLDTSIEFQEDPKISATKFLNFNAVAMRNNCPIYSVNPGKDIDTWLAFSPDNFESKKILFEILCKQVERMRGSLLKFERHVRDHVRRSDNIFIGSLFLKPILDVFKARAIFVDVCNERGEITIQHIISKTYCDLLQMLNLSEIPDNHGTVFINGLGIKKIRRGSWI